MIIKYKFKAINKLTNKLKRVISKFINLPKFLCIKIIRCYQLFISPMLGPRCRFYPTCSQYAIEAFKIHGFCKGLIFTLIRLSKCHPYHSGGIDHVPPKNLFKNKDHKKE